MDIIKALSTLACTAAVVLMAACTVEKESKELPIMSWYSIPANEATLERYQELKECGFNVNFSHLYNIEDAMKALELGEQVGVGIMFMCNELRTRPDSTVNLVKDHPALYGYFLRDEPLPKDFPDLAAWAERIRNADDTHPMYLNLFPSYVDSAALGCTYREYVRRFIEEVKLPLVSFDNYPIVNEGIRQLWYENLEIIASESERAGLPFWAFALSTAHMSYPLPTMASLRIQMYTNLAYGAQGLQYFTYWNPGTETWDFHDAPINLEGERTEAYDLVKAMNKELQARADVFVGSKVVSVCHTGEEIPVGTRRLEEIPAHVTELQTVGGAIVSLLENGKDLYLVVVNRSMDDTVDLSIGFESKTCMIDREGKCIKVDKAPAVYQIEGGDCLIFKYRK